MQAALVFILGVGCISALLSCVLGWLLSLNSSYDVSTLLLHQWIGICTALVSGACWWLKKKKGTPTERLYNILLGTLFVSLLLTGHWGGTMTHGEGYLSAETLFGDDTKKFERKPIADIREAVIYTDLVEPVLFEKCYNCHGAKKTKGGLRIDSEKLLLKGGKSGPAIHPGNPDDSELMIRLLLPMDDDKRMPPKKQPQLTAAETELLHWWIKNGAPTEAKVKELSSDALQIVLASLGETADHTEEITPLSMVFDKQLPPADPAVVVQLRQMGMLVEPVTKGSQLLDVSCVNFPAFDDTHMELLEKIAANIVSLKIDNTDITDVALEKISVFENLVRLHLGNTAVTGASMSRLQSLSALEYLNITGTRVDDKGLHELSSLPALKQVYCWNSLVTQKGIAMLKDKKPGIMVVAGSE